MNIPKSVDTKKELEVYFLQYGLAKHGFDPKGLDGKRGSNTEKALEAAFAAVSKGKPTDTPPWHELALEYVGLREVPGTKSNKTILGWIKSFFSWADDDSTVAWCAIFVNTMLAKSGKKGTGKANARSFLAWGRSVRAPKKGDVVVFWRNNPKSWQGHVGFYAGDAGNGYIYCLGGNQNNKVSIAKYPKHRVLGYRRGFIT